MSTLKKKIQTTIVNVHLHTNTSMFFSRKKFFLNEKAKFSVLFSNHSILNFILFDLVDIDLAFQKEPLTLKSENTSCDNPELSRSHQTGEKNVSN